MIKRKPTAPNTSKPTKSDDYDEQSFLSIGIVFAAVGFALLIPEASRATGIPFVILGLTFVALSRQGPTKPKKS